MRTRKVKPLAKGSDLLQIKGLGPATLSRLEQGGLHTCAQLAALSPTELTKRIPRLAVSHTTLERWITQARRLAARPATRKTRLRAPSADQPPTPLGAQRYATFTVELLLDEAGQVRRTRAVHVQGGHQGMWAEWDEAQLLNFLTQQSGLRNTAAKTRAPRQKPIVVEPPSPEAAAPDRMLSSSPPSLTIREVRLLVPIKADELRTVGGKKLRVEIEVEIGGSAAETMAERMPHLTVTALACEAATGHMQLLGSSQTLLDTPSMTTTISFSTLGLGQHQLLALAALPELDVAAVAVGPKLSVIAPPALTEVENWPQPVAA